MLVTNSRIDKLAALQVHLDTRGLLGVSAPADATAADSIDQRVKEGIQEEGDDDGEAVDGNIDAEVVLSKTPGVCYFLYIFTSCSQRNTQYATCLKT